MLYLGMKQTHYSALELQLASGARHPAYDERTPSFECLNRLARGSNSAPYNKGLGVALKEETSSPCSLPRTQNSGALLLSYDFFLFLP